MSGPGQGQSRFLEECARRSLAQGSAAVRATSDLNIPGAEDVPTDVMRGQVDFAAERCRLGVGAEVVIITDGQLLYERKEDGRWIRNRLPPGRYCMFDPRGMLELLATGCEAAHASGDGEYRVHYDRARTAQWAHPNLAPSWTQITGTVEVDAEHRVAKVSVRMGTASGEDYTETTLSLGDFGVPVQIEPPADDQVIEHDDYLIEVFGEEVLREYFDKGGD